jgi:hypothetical protein
MIFPQKRQVLFGKNIKKDSNNKKIMVDMPKKG